MNKEYRQVVWDEQLESDWREILRIAMREDLGQAGDWTSRALIPEDTIGQATIIARESGILAGLPAAELALDFFDPRLEWTSQRHDGDVVEAGDHVALLYGPAANLLTAERLILNLLSRLSGIATLTQQYIRRVASTKARIYDTRKTTPGWRRLEKYAVRCGGGQNHRSGLYEAILIKDNHLALGPQTLDGTPLTLAPAEAIVRVRHYIETHVPQPQRAEMILEIEVDTLEQLDAVLPAKPDIVLLDNMTPDQLRKAVTRRDACDRQVELEASGGVNLETVEAIAQSGVDRISVGALTHSVTGLDLSLDWLPSPSRN